MSTPIYPAAEGFPSLSALQENHPALVKEVGPDVLAAGNPDRIVEFVRRGQATGAILDSKEDRAAAQALINFWTARLASAARTARGPRPPPNPMSRHSMTPFWPNLIRTHSN